MALVVGLCYAPVFVAIHIRGLDGIGLFYTCSVHIPFVVFVTVAFKRPPSLVLMAFYFSYFSLAPRQIFGGLSALFAQRLEIPIDLMVAQRLGWLLTGPIIFWPMKRFLIPPLRRLMDLPKTDRIIFLGLGGFSFLVIKIMSLKVDADDHWLPLLRGTLFSLFILAFMISLVLYSRMIRESGEVKARLIAFERQSDGLALYADSLHDFLDETRRLRHDQRHFLTILDLYAERGDVEAVRRMVGEQLAVFDAPPARSSGSSVADGLIAHFRKRAAEKGVAIDLRGDELSALPLSEDALCMILSNAIDNAINATQALRAGPRDVLLSVTRNADTGTIALEIRNHCAGPLAFNDDGLPASTRGPGHGYGTRSIESIVRKHGGVCGFSVEDDDFIFRAVFFTSMSASLREPGTRHG